MNAKGSKEKVRDNSSGNAETKAALDFPATYRVGQNKATVYYTPTKGCDSFTVTWYEGALRKRKYFPDPNDAWNHAVSMVDSLSAGEIEEVRLSGEERLSYARAKEAIKEFGVSLDSAAVEYCDAKRLLRGGSLVEAARFYAAQRMLDIPKKSVAEVFEEMLQAKRDEGLSPRYIGDLNVRLRRFVPENDGEIAALKGPKIRAWIQGLKVANRSRNNFRLAIQTLLSFAKAQQYLPRDWNEMESVPLWKLKEEEVEIFTPGDLISLLSLSDTRLLPFLVIGAFGGLRSAEIARLDWAKINLQSGYITVDASIAKTNSRRLVPITPNLKEWLIKHRRARGPVVEIANVPNAIQKLVNATRPPRGSEEAEEKEPTIPWRHNALRHSFCSYRLAEVKSAAQVALEAGNSPQMIFKHYRELVMEEQAKEWFSITPEVVAKVTPLPGLKKAA
jgi:integrase